jgi:seryl-tRNA synthetase
MSFLPGLKNPPSSLCSDTSLEKGGLKGIYNLKSLTIHNMIDIKQIRKNPKEYQAAADNKNIKINIQELLELDSKRRELQTRINDLRTERNQLAGSAKSGKPSDEQIQEGKRVKAQIVEVEKHYQEIDEEFEKIMVKVPTITSEDTPIGPDDSGNVPVAEYGSKPKFDFEPKSHIELGEKLDIIDIDRGVKVAGYRGYYLKNEGATLALALMQFALHKLIQKGFTPMLPPTLVREFALFGSGYFAGRTYDPEHDEIYKIANEEVEADGKRNKENKFLIGTAEPSLLSYYSGEVLKEGDLPLKLCGFSQCYRSEIGSYGKDTRGIYRVHEFMKVEQVCITRADVEEADKMHTELVDIAKELHDELNLPYRVLRICTGDMGAGKYKMFDLEAWMPSRNDWGETGSASNFLDWQARRLNVRYEAKDGTKPYVYMLNNTALATVRPLIAILENFQQKDGSVVIPEVLRPYIPGNPAVISQK